ncbi:MAG: LysM peptidoglycan-binding domain-containing protein, partial [Verrucomicrobiota bacterium]
TNDIDPKMVETANRAEAAPQPVLAETTGFRPAPMAEKKIEPVKEITRSAAVIQGVEYIVRKGDTLSGIASRYGVKVTEIQQANQLDSSMIRIGQKLMLPGVNDLASMADAAPEAVTSMAKPAPRAATVSTGTYTVSKGDTLWKISRKFSTTPQAIASLNGISDPSKLRAGNTIKVPNTSSSAAAGSVETTTDMAMVPGA